MPERISKVNARLLARARKLREDLHRHPEIRFEEHRTAERVADELCRIGLDEVRTGVAGTGVVGLLRGARPGPTVALRADMDALLIHEETGAPYASENEGVMHACGHDGHTAVLVAVAELLAGMRESLTGNVKFIFQPGEEGGGGAKIMVEEGCLEDPRPDAIFALHARGILKLGQIELSPTPNAAVDGFAIHILGKGGHGAKPHLCIDPIAIGVQIINECQTIITREVRPDRPAVLSFCAFNAGSLSNVIPERATIKGTIRATEMPVLRQIRKAVEKRARSVARTMRGSVEFEDEEIYPPVHNDVKLLELVRTVGTDLLGRRNVRDSREQSMGAEDFAFYLPPQGGVPGVIFSLGVECDAYIHNPHFDFGSKALEPGILMMANLALAVLGGGQ
jgi:amidohydrolase